MIKKQLYHTYPQKWAQIIVLLGFCFLLYFLNLGQWDLWNPDEPRYAQVAREMINGGDWILMHFNGKVYEDKPPLFFWFIALSSYLWQGFSSFSVRFPAALFGTLTVLLTFLLGKNLYSTRTGFFSGLILATSLEFAYLSTRANIDTTLTFFTTASLLCFFQWYQYPVPDPSPLPSGEREGGEGELAWAEKGQKPFHLWFLYQYGIGYSNQRASRVYPSPFNQFDLSPHPKGLEGDEGDEAFARDDSIYGYCPFMVSSGCMERRAGLPQRHIV